MKLFFDGACRPNPGEMQLAVVTGGKCYHKTGLGYGSSEEAEWLALLHSLEIASVLGLSEALLLGDSASVINQANGKTRCRSTVLQQHLASYNEKAERFSNLRLRHIKRTQNLAGIAIQKLAATSEL
ncbi:MAG TPA: reverse transcriptase-like protein [Allosphingosinicella sp.]|nr:reverse transcriptase-like protein [Allosphingosinicella sp.]